MTFPYAIPGVYSRPRRRAEGFARVRTDVCGFVGVAGPRHLGRSVMVDDWKAYVAAFRTDDLNQPVAPPPGAVLDATLRDFFANGGRRAVIVNVAASTDADDRDHLLNLMLGLAGDLAPHGLELLLRHPEVSVVALPDLHAEVATLEDWFDEDDLGDGSCFGPCRGHRRPPSGGQGTVGVAATEALFDQDRLLWAQRYLVERLLRQPWRWFALLTPPKGLSVDGAISWRGRLTRGMEGPSVAALYWPWMRMQDSPGALSELRAPLGAVAGIFADIDITGGPHLAPANRTILGGIGPERPLTDEDNARLYEAGVNVIREFAGRGPQLWGARTLAWTSYLSRAEPLSFVNARRCLNAIARTCEVIGQPIVFQPNTVVMRIRLHQMLTDYLLRVHAFGALMGDRADQGFFVAVDTVEDSPPGQMVARIGVALATPAEFIEFRIGRETGTIEEAEAA